MGLSVVLCTGFRITSGIAVTTGVVFGLQQACNMPAGGCIKILSPTSPEVPHKHKGAEIILLYIHNYYVLYKLCTVNNTYYNSTCIYSPGYLYTQYYITIYWRSSNPERSGGLSC